MALDQGLLQVLTEFSRLFSGGGEKAIFLFVCHLACCFLFRGSSVQLSWGLALVLLFGGNPWLEAPVVIGSCSSSDMDLARPA